LLVSLGMGLLCLVMPAGLRRAATSHTAADHHHRALLTVRGKLALVVLLAGQAGMAFKKLARLAAALGGCRRWERGFPEERLISDPIGLICTIFPQNSPSLARSRQDALWCRTLLFRYDHILT
jgi:hypothetical protein